MQKCKKSNACAVLWGFGGACFALALFALKAMRWLYLLCAVGWWAREYRSRISVRRGLQGDWVGFGVGGVQGDYRWCLQRFCKIYAKMARFCATICADRFRSCYLKAVPDCAKDLRLGSVCQCSAPMFEAVLRLLGLAEFDSLSLGLASVLAWVGFCATPDLLALRLNPSLFRSPFSPPKPKA